MLSPDHVDAHLGLAIVLFLQGRYAEAWGEYEWRLKTNPVAGLSEENRWKGEPLRGERSSWLCRARRRRFAAIHPLCAFG